MTNYTKPVDTTMVIVQALQCSGISGSVVLVVTVKGSCEVAEIKLQEMIGKTFEDCSIHLYINEVTDPRASGHTMAFLPRLDAPEGLACTLSAPLAVQRGDEKRCCLDVCQQTYIVVNSESPHLKAVGSYFRVH